MNTLAIWIFNVIVVLEPPAKLAPYVKESEVDMRARFESISEDMAFAIQNRKLIFDSKTAELEEASLIVSIADHESSFLKIVDNGSKRGDNGRSCCLMQANIGGGTVSVGEDAMKKWTGKDLISDRKKCFSAGIEYIRTSMKMCSYMKGSDVLTGYTTGHCMKGEKTARERWDGALELRAKHPFPFVIAPPSVPQSVILVTTEPKSILLMSSEKK